MQVTRLTLEKRFFRYKIRGKEEVTDPVRRCRIRESFSIHHYNSGKGGGNTLQVSSQATEKNQKSTVFELDVLNHDI